MIGLGENLRSDNTYAPAPATVTAPARSLIDVTSEDLTVTILRAGSVLIVLFQTAYLFLDLGLKHGLNLATLPLHLANIATGVIGFFIALTPLGQRHWRALTLWAIAVILFSTAALSVMSGRNEPFYLSVVLMVTGTAAMMPWESRWQLALNVVAMFTMLVVTLQVQDHLFEMHLLTGFIAIGVAQTSVYINEHYRRVIETARIAALEASEAKSGFLSSMSHEIRTPMNAIVGLAEVLGETPLTSEQRRYVNTMFANGKSLLELINNILDIAKIESGRLATMEAEFDPAELAEQVAESLALRAHEKNLELTVWIDPEVPAAVVGDPMRLRQILVNLLGNAVKFTEFGEVSLAVERASSAPDRVEICFTITDTGIGIPEEKLEAVFQVFTQVDSTASRRHEGSGLGLTIVNRLLDLLGGKLSVRSQILKGSSFRATVPFELPSTSVQPQAPRPELDGNRILIVDDNATSRSILAGLIKSAGGHADQCSSGSDALAEIQVSERRGAPYSILLIDSKMPGLDGCETVKLLRERNERIPAILMLSSDELHLKADPMREAGLKNYLVKPIKRAELTKSLREVLMGGIADSAAADPETRIEEPAAAAVGRILLAEDNPGNRMLVKAYLKGAPFQIDEAENGALAVKKFTSQKYDIVLMDMYMPVVNGYEATAAIRKWEADQKAPRTTIIALTAAAMAGDMQRSIDAGCDFHVTKPVSKSVLLGMLETIKRGLRATAPPSSSYDPVSDLDDDPALFAEVSQLFITEMERLLVSIEAAFAASDFKKLGEAVHGLKGSAAMVGANRIAALCKDIEAAITAGSSARIKQALSDLASEEPRAREALGKRAEVLAQA